MSTGKTAEGRIKAIELVSKQKEKIFTKEQVIDCFNDKSIVPQIILDEENARRIASSILESVDGTVPDIIEISEFHKKRFGHSVMASDDLFAG